MTYDAVTTVPAGCVQTGLRLNPEGSDLSAGGTSTSYGTGQLMILAEKPSSMATVSPLTALQILKGS